jgi:hypothetical protein
VISFLKISLIEFILVLWKRLGVASKSVNGRKAMWTEARIVELLSTNALAVERAMVAIYNLQTADERESGETRRLNGVGFSGAHARKGTYYAKWVLNGKRLSGKHLESARKMALSYRKQLLMLANGKL